MGGAEPFLPMVLELGGAAGGGDWAGTGDMAGEVVVPSPPTNPPPAAGHHLNVSTSLALLSRSDNIYICMICGNSHPKVNTVKNYAKDYSVGLLVWY